MNIISDREIRLIGGGEDFTKLFKENVMISKISLTLISNLKEITYYHSNRIGGVMVSVLASSAVDRGLEPQPGRTKTIKLVFIASPISTQ